MKRKVCYFGAEDCRNGHLQGCPYVEFSLSEDNPWDERTKPSATSLPAAEDDLMPRPLKTTWRRLPNGQIVGDA